MRITDEQKNTIEEIKEAYKLDESDYELTRTRNRGVIMYFEDSSKWEAHIISVDGYSLQLRELPDSDKALKCARDQATTWEKLDANMEATKAEGKKFPSILYYKEELKMANHEKVQYELSVVQDAIVEDAKKVREHAYRLQRELDDAIRLADQVIENVEDSIHYPVTPWANSSWEDMPVTATKLDTTIKAYRTMKKIQKLMSES